MNREHLRAYLLIEAGHLGIIERKGQISELAATEMQAVMRAMGNYTRIRPGKDIYYVVYPLSIKYKELPHKEACKVFSDVDEILCCVFSINTTDMLLPERRKAA